MRTRRSDTGDAHLLDPMDWAQLALSAGSIGAAFEDLKERLGRVMHINTMMLIGGAPLPSGYGPGCSMTIPSQRYMEGYTISLEWMEYLQTYADQDPVPKRFRINAGPLLVWEGSDLMSSFTEQETQFARKYFDYGLRRGLMIANIDVSTRKYDALAIESHAPQAEFASFCFSQRAQLEVAYAWFCEAIKVRNFERKNNSPILSPRQRDCLAWSASGLTSSEIADRLRIAQDTVDEYVRTAKFRLGSVSRTQACARASLLGEIQL